MIPEYIPNAQKMLVKIIRGCITTNKWTLKIIVPIVLHGKASVTLHGVFVGNFNVNVKQKKTVS